MRSLFLLAITLHTVASNWWYTSQFDIDSVADPRALCNIVPGLTRRQRQICLRDPRLVMTVAEGVRKGIEECQFQFQYHRWNCTTFPNDVSLFGREFIKGGSRELAYIEAMTSAAATFNLARECARGFPHCTCAVDNWSQFQAHRLTQTGEFKWRGCDEDLKFSTSFVRRFSAAQEHRSQDIKAITTRHNTRVGRHILKSHAAKLCKCHGLSGSCTMRTCWSSIANLRLVSSLLREKYDAAVEVNFDPSGKPLPTHVDQRGPRRTDLMFYERSKDLCTPQPSRGILGTRNRPCKVDAEGEESCDILCCGQGYNVVKSQVTERCNCVFHWCCEVKCQLCNVTKYNSFCT